MTPDMVEHALAYAALGWPIFPLAPGQKHPDGELAPNGLKNATTDPESIRRWWELRPDAGIGLATGPDAGVWVLDLDGQDGINAFTTEAARHGRDQDTLVVKTAGGGLHAFYRWQPDQPVKNRASLLGGKVDVRGDGGYVVLPPSVHPSGNRYQWAPGRAPHQLEPAPAPAWVNDLVTTKTRADEPPRDAAGYIAGGRNNHLASQAGAMRRRGMTADAIEAALLVENSATCRPPLPPGEVQQIARSIARYAPEHDDPILDRTPGLWPDPLHPDAFHGPLGDIAMFLDQLIESGPENILAHALTLFGNAVGPAIAVNIGADRHAGVLHTVIVGPSAIGRKGTALAPTLRIVEHACQKAGDLAWDRQVKWGLSTGEGVVQMLRDPRFNKDGEEVDEGASDIRMCAVLGELGQLLAAAQREQNTLTAVLRNGWDGRALEVLTRGQPLRASRHHLSMVGHITPDELERRMPDGWAQDGTANRWLFVVTRRNREIAEPSHIDSRLVGELAAPLTAAIQHAGRLNTQTGLLKMTDDARDLYRSRYRHLTDVGTGPVGELKARSLPLVLRCATIYAAADQATAVDVPHLAAALAVVDYSSRSIDYLFATNAEESTRDRLVRQILSRLAEHSDGLDRATLHRSLEGVTGRDLTAALRDIDARQLAAHRQDGEREVWTARKEAA